MKKVAIGDAISAGWEIYKTNFGLVFLATLLALLLSGVSCGILAGPMSAGLFMVLMRLVRKGDPKPAVGDIFKGFDKFLPTFLLILICGICYQILIALLMLIPIVGWIVAILLMIVYGPIITWALMLVADRNMKWTEAIGLVLKSTFNGAFTMPLLLGVVAGLIGALGAVACGIGVLFTLPLTSCIYAAGYEQAFGADAAAPVAPTPELPAA